MKEESPVNMPKLSAKKAIEKVRRNRAQRKVSSAHLVEFPLAKGRTVEKVELSLDPNFHCVSIRFKDKTDLTVVINMALTFQAAYSEWKAGEQKVLKRWPLVRSDGM